MCDSRNENKNVPKPLAATSVATRMGALPDLKSNGRYNIKKVQLDVFWC